MHLLWAEQAFQKQPIVFELGLRLPPRYHLNCIRPCKPLTIRAADPKSDTVQRGVALRIEVSCRHLMATGNADGASGAITRTAESSCVRSRKTNSSRHGLPSRLQFVSQPLSALRNPIASNSSVSRSRESVYALRSMSL